MSLGQKVQEAILEIMTLYLDESDPRPWTVGWSGGKDSTVTLDLLLKALRSIPTNKRNRRVYALMTDTAVETPLLIDYMKRQVTTVNQWAEGKALPFEAHLLTRREEDSFWYLVIGRGYPLPKNMNRWCTDKLKIIPQNLFIGDKDPALIFTGARHNESQKRSQSIEKHQIGAGSKFGSHSQFKNARTYMPILDWTERDVWNYLVHDLSWGPSEEIRDIYKDATGECALINPEGATEYSSACGTRFGCYVCPVVKEDRSSQNMANVYPWMAPLVAFRKTLMATFAHRLNRCGHQRIGKYLGEGKGSLCIPERKKLFTVLIATQDEVNKLRAEDGLEPTELIGQLEIDMIHAQWEEDEAERPWLMRYSHKTQLDWNDEFFADEEEEFGAAFGEVVA